ncbi:partitioning defective 3 homolog isoform X2 [Hydractinia symbiolongicarpus]|uniref:partitioning defective 3 homolog isoform X2 n=1 Tax=Hydractinia symbiolongicarpus TaxID=13093 RepID=UPI00254B214C|nr:partitioning defective 3 homolog isoform X2 [Hydractinia symbiolongicarpus]
MRVTVSFGEARVIVPCGDGELTVLELTNRAISRYRKAQKGSGKVRVDCLKTKEEHAILDIDDLVVDVCDDKDMLDYREVHSWIDIVDEMRDGNLTDVFVSVPSSPGKGYNVLVSPIKIAHEWGSLIAVYDETNPKPSKHDRSDIDNNNIASTPVDAYCSKQEEDTNIILALSDNDSGVAADSYGISSNQTSTHTSLNSSSRPPRGIQRKFPQNKNASFRSSVSSNSPASSPELAKRALKPVFSRDLNRKSLSTNHPMLYSWIDQQDKFNSGYRVSQEQSDENDSEKSNEEIELDKHALKSVDIKPYTTADGREIGLVVHHVIEGSYVDRTGELQTADRITEINGIQLDSLSNAAVQDIFEEALISDIIKIKRTRSHMFLKDQIKLDHIPQQEVPKEVLQMSKEAPRVLPVMPNSEPKEAAIEAPSTELKNEDTGTNKKIYFHVNLLKGKDGLGFSITSRDVATTESRMFFVKNVLHKGAAIVDGRIKAGDELMKVNNVLVNDKNQAQVVQLLRQAQGMVVLQLARPRNSTTEEDASISLERNEETISSHQESISPQNEDILTLTIPLTSQGSAGLGISVKGKRSGEQDDDQGIYVKSVIKGGAAAKDGRIIVNDQLLCINDTSLIGLSNNDAMNVLRASMEKSIALGAIRIIIGRSQSAPKDSRPSSGSFSSGAPSPFRGPSPILHGGVKMLHGHSPMTKRRSYSEQDVEREFDEKYLKKHYSPNRHNINRNKSYFKAVSPRPEHNGGDSESENPSPRSVSVSSGEIPIIQKSTPVYIESGNNRYNVDVRSSMNEKHRILPSYEEALHRRDTNSSNSSQSSRTETVKSDSTKFKLLPDKTSIPKEEKLLSSHFEKSLSLDSRTHGSMNDLKDPEHELYKSMSIASQSSLDSILVGPNQIPFSRHAFGRSSISERKGRAHIDATKSDFYNKLKKFKSMEELRGSKMLDDEDIVMAEDNQMVSNRRSESIDTLISKIDEEERSPFYRGTVFSSSTPWSTTYTEGEGKLRAGKRNNALNTSFKTAIDRPMNEDQQTYNEKKKKGFLKGISTLLKKNKKQREDRGQSPEYLNPTNSTNNEMFTDSLKPGTNKNKNKRPVSVAGNLMVNKTADKSLKYFQADQLQKELVQAKMEEMDKRKKRKSHLGVTTKEKEQGETQVAPHKSSYQSWEAHDAANMREKSKQLFNEDEIRTSKRSIQLQRQSSLPPRNKKDSVDQRMLPKMPSGPMYKSPETSPKNKHDHTRGSNSAPNSKPSTPVRKVPKSAFDSLPRKKQIKKDSSQHTLGSRQHANSSTMYSSISDLTRKGGSVSISHKADI